MHNAEDFIESILAHSGTRYYDPVKAREYYLRTRELKGRQKGSDLKTDQKRQAWAYSKNEIKEAEKKAQENLRKERDATIDDLREGAKEKVAEIREQMKQLLERVRKNLKEDVDRQIRALPKMPKGLSKEAAEKFAAERREKIAKIRGEAADEKAAVSEVGRKEREAVGAELKAGLESARTRYNELKEELKTKYENEYQQEYDAIKAKV